MRFALLLLITTSRLAGKYIILARQDFGWPIIIICRKKNTEKKKGVGKGKSKDSFEQYVS